MTRLKCTFVPQVWERDYAITLEFENTENTWEVEIDGELPEPHSYDSDRLRDVPQAPDWVRVWPGPFEVNYEVIS